MKPDNNFFSFADVCDRTVVGQTYAPERPEDYDDVLKVSNCQRMTFIGCNINPDGGNREDGVDVMRNSDGIKFVDCTVGCGQKYAFTIKGGSKEVELDGVIIHGRPGAEGVDIDIGNFSSTTPNAKTGVVRLLGVTRDNGKPVTVRVGWAEKPVIIGGNVKVLFWSSLALKAFVRVKRLFA